ncbi:MAG: Xaa-Pro peptidase family protein [Candidatus Omnitrophica bacterium]|nr:Xaa-Pro peptidase family protein [Candidatus Omnitrophota bacterium]MDD5487347.1 Xaa-Pro peptidase family protein [Candidatus Omnitrophota bacterium]
MANDVLRVGYALKGIKAACGAGNMDALLLSARYDIEYIAGLYVSGSMLLCPRRGRPVFFVDSMNFSLASSKLKGKGISVCKGPVAENLAAYSGDNGLKRIAFDEESLSVARFKYIEKQLRGVFLSGSISGRSAASVLMDIRMIKSRDEVRIIRKAARETVRIWEYARAKVRKGMKESDIAFLIDKRTRDLGYESSFRTIVAIGPNSAHPHAIPGTATFAEGKLLLADFGILYNGYCSDLTRTFYKGRINGKIKGLLRAVHEAHDMAISSIRPGVKISSVVEGVSGIFSGYKYKKYALHGLGHGIGIEVHERPYLGSQSNDVFMEGMVVTVEPGLYCPGLAGVREEDMVLVTSKGCEVLTV